MPPKSSSKKKSTTVTDSSSISTPASPVVDTIFPRHRLHIIGGPAHSGKTSLLFRIMADWSVGLNVFGFKSHKAPFCYISCVDPLEACEDVAKRMGMSDINIPMISGVDEGGVKTFDDVYSLVVRRVPDVEVIFLDSILRIAESSGLDNKLVGDVLDKLVRALRERRITLIATGRCAKPKDTKQNIRSIDRFLGATCWTEFGSTFVGIEPRSPSKPRDDRRRVVVMPKGAAAFDLFYRFTQEGHLVEVADDNTADSPTSIETLSDIFSVYDPGSELTTTELLDLGQSIGILARSTMMSYLQMFVKSGKLQDAGYGRYRIPLVQ